jgi:hypothetical protein
MTTKMRAPTGVVAVVLGLMAATGCGGSGGSKVPRQVDTQPINPTAVDSSRKFGDSHIPIPAGVDEGMKVDEITRRQRYERFYSGDPIKVPPGKSLYPDQGPQIVPDRPDHK